MGKHLDWDTSGGHVRAGVPGSRPKRRVWPWILLVVGLTLLVFCGVLTLIAAAGTNDTTGCSPSCTTPDAGTRPKMDTFKVGQAVRGGDFEVVVHGNKCGITQVGGEFTLHKPQGTFCRVDLTVKNVTKSAHFFHADSAVKARAGDVVFSADSEAGIYGNKDAAGFLDEINPGNQVRAFVYFDVPKGTKLDKIVFDAGLFTFAEDAEIQL